MGLSLRDVIMGEEIATDLPLEVAGSWKPVDFDAVVDEAPSPTVLHRTDGQALLYPGMVNVLQGEPASGKSWIALKACSEEIAAGRHVLYVDFEAGAPDVKGRLLSLGLTHGQIAGQFHYVRPEDRMGTTGQEHLRFTLEAFEPSLVIVDGVAEALSLERYKENDAQDIAAFRNGLSRLCANTGAVVVEIDHVGRATPSRGLDARGSGAKRGGVQGAAYVSSVQKPFMRGVSGVGRLVVAKDRHGFVGLTGAHVVVVRFNADADGSLSIELDVPGEDGELGRLRNLMDAYSRHIELRPGLTTRELRAVVAGRQDYKDKALARLVDQGYVRVEKDRQARRHFSEKPFRTDQGVAA
jgi:hypothetical protein